MRRRCSRGRLPAGKHACEGSVSIFLMIALSLVFMFAAVFIDYARVAAMKVQTERLARSAVRSVMSSFDQELQQQYGLYAYGDTSGDLILGRALNSSLSPGERGDAFNLISLELDSSGLEFQRPLGKYDTFNRQMVEEMKYKAPVDFTMELLNKFKPLSSSMKEASNTVDVLKKLRKLYDEREEALDKMLISQRKAGESVIPLSKLIMEPPGDSIADEELGGSIGSADDAAAQYNDYIDKSQEDAARPPKEPKLYTLIIQDYLRGVSSVSSALSSRVAMVSAEHDKHFAEAEELWELASRINGEMKQVIEVSRNRSETEGYDWVSNGQSHGTDGAGSEDADIIRSIREQADQLVHTEQFMQELKAGINHQIRLWSDLESRLTGLISSLGGPGMKGTVTNASAGAADYIRKYGEPGANNILDQEAALLEQTRSSDKERKENEKKAAAKLKDVSKAIHSLRETGGGGNEIAQQFRLLEQYYKESLAFNEGSGTEGSGSSFNHDPYEAGKSSMDQMDSAYGAMGVLVSSVRDELFQNEYAVQYFEHFDITRLSGMLNDSSSKESLSEELSVYNQEVEYILYGFHQQAANIAAAYGEIFAARLAVRTMEGFVVNGKLGNPLLILSAALLYGIEKAIEDMIQLSKTGSIELSKYIPVDMTYRDYLRVFLFVHSHNERKMSRMLALIRLNTGINPAEKPTYVSGEVVTAMRLWFLPGITKTIGAALGSGTDQVQGRLIHVTRQADFSY